MDPDYRIYYELESLVFDAVGPRWRRQGWLSSLDFFAIIVWKSNRAKTRIRDRLLKHGGSLDDAVRDLTSALAASPDVRSGLACLIDEWKFRLPMATAVLTVLHPNEATVYDVRVCDELKSLEASWQFDRLGNLSRIDDIWDGYTGYVQAVRAAAPDGLSLRDKDRWLWGRSFHRSLVALVEDASSASPPISKPKSE
jgi:hypothetical protein